MTYTISTIFSFSPHPFNRHFCGGIFFAFSKAMTQQDDKGIISEGKTNKGVIVCELLS
jgi:hypothetical protein